MCSDYKYVRATVKEFEAKIGQSATLACVMQDLTARGHWSWSFEHGSLPTNAEVVVLSKHASTLNITKVKNKYLGVYTCEYEDPTHHYSFYDTVYIVKKSLLQNPFPRPALQSGYISKCRFYY